MKTTVLFWLTIVILISGCTAGTTHKDVSRDFPGTVDNLYQLPAGIQMRWATAENPRGEKGAGGTANAGRKGSPCLRDFNAGQSHVLAEATGTSGIIRRIWITIDDRSPTMIRGLKLEMFWDGSKKPAVSAPLGDFFCHTLGQMATFESALFSSPEGRSFNCCIPMPFRTGMKIVVTNETEMDLKMFFYEVDYTLGDRLNDDSLYFHACYRRENPTIMQRDYEILPRIVGRGRYLGAAIGVIADKALYYSSWWGEGEVKIYLDGDRKLPTLCGTGTEDYIGTGWGQGAYSTQYQGCPFADGKNMHYSFYRLHVPDPIYFYKDIRVTIQQIGCWDPDTKKQMFELGKPVFRAGPGRNKADLSGGASQDPYGIFERRDDWSSCSFFYLDRPVNDLPLIDPVEKRIEGL